MTATVRTIIAAVLVVTAVAVFRPSPVETQGPPPINVRLATLEAQVATLQTQVTALLAANATLQGNINAEATARTAADTGLQTQIDNIPTVPQSLLDLASYVSVDLNTLGAVAGPHVIFTGANVHIRAGNGTTFEQNGLGNLIVGYDEQLPVFGVKLRDGSHNIVVGACNGFSSFGGLVVGHCNTISGAFASVSGGQFNTASALGAAVSGGSFNSASQVRATVSGGNGNLASGQNSVVSGGDSNTSSGQASTVSGGQSIATAVNFSHVP